VYFVCVSIESRGSLTVYSIKPYIEPGLFAYCPNLTKTPNTNSCGARKFLTLFCNPYVAYYACQNTTVTCPPPHIAAHNMRASVDNV
jgi:hypothetical protein